MTENRCENFSRITDWCHALIRSLAPREGNYIDATMGKGNDTLLLARLAGEQGQVLAFDIQKEALDMTKALLKENGVEDRAKLILDGHEQMDRYAKKESMDVICFNFGYLPGGDHNIATAAKTSVAAVQKGLEILKHGGFMSLCIYSGGDSGYEEKDGVLAYLRTLDSQRYLVICSEYYNRPNHPPIPVLIVRL